MECLLAMLDSFFARVICRSDERSLLSTSSKTSSFVAGCGDWGGELGIALPSAGA